MRFPDFSWGGTLWSIQVHSGGGLSIKGTAGLEFFIEKNLPGPTSLSGIFKFADFDSTFAESVHEEDARLRQKKN